jgi:hypothetical protein
MNDFLFRRKYCPDTDGDGRSNARSGGVGGDLTSDSESTISDFSEGFNVHECMALLIRI